MYSAIKGRMNRMSATKKVVNDHLTITKWLAAEPEAKRCSQFSFHFSNDRIFFFLFRIPTILIIPILAILIPEETNKTRPESSKADHTCLLNKQATDTDILIFRCC